MGDAELRKQRIDGIDLHTVAATFVSEIGRRNVIFAFRNEPRKRTEAFENCCSPARPVNPLQKFLQDQSDVPRERLVKEFDGGMRYVSIAPNRK